MYLLTDPALTGDRFLCFQVDTKSEGEGEEAGGKEETETAEKGRFCWTGSHGRSIEEKEVTRFTCPTHGTYSKRERQSRKYIHSNNHSENLPLRRGQMASLLLIKTIFL